MTTVSTDFNCVYLLPGREPYTGHVAMVWDMNEPFKVTLDFTNADESHSEWIVSRDVFADCLLNGPGPHFGGGDFTVNRGLASMGIELNSPEGNASVSFPLQPVVAFVSQTLHIIPRGEQEFERIATEMDEFITDVLDNG